MRNKQVFRKINKSLLYRMKGESRIKKLYYTENVLYAFAEDGLLYRYYFK